MSIARVALIAAAFTLAGCNSSEKAGKPEQKDGVVAAQPVATQQPPAQAERPLTREESVNIALTAKVKSIDLTTRRVTLTDASGDEVSFTADPAIQRLSEVRAGDTVTARYRATLLAELRPPTAEESASPIAYVQIAGRAPKTDEPAAAGGEAVRVVTTVEAVDVPNMIVTLRGPMGDLATVRGRNAENVKRIRRGDTIVITFAHAIGVSLEKAP